MKIAKYIFMVLLGGIMYGTMSSLVKISYANGYTAAQLSFWQAFLAAIILAVCTVVSRKQGEGLRKSDIIPLLLTGSAIGLTNFLYYYSVFYIPASLAIVLLMQYTWIGSLIERVIFHHKVSRIEIITIAFILIGTVLGSSVIESGKFTVSITRIGLALLSSLTYAVYIIANGRCGHGVRWEAKSMLIMLGSSLTILAINGPGILSTSYLDLHFAGWVIFLALGGTAIPTALFAAGIPKVGAPFSAILMTVEMPTAVLCAHFLLHEHLTLLQIIGVIVLLSAVAAMNYFKLTRPIKG